MGDPVLTLARLTGATALLAVSWSSVAVAQPARNTRERVMVIPTLTCGSQHQWDSATYVERRAWVGLDTVRHMRLSVEDFHDSGVDTCEDWVYRRDSTRAYNAEDAAAFASLFRASVLLSVRTLAGPLGVVADVGIHIGAKPPVREHYISTPLPTAEQALDELMPRIRAVLARAGVLPSR